MIIFEKITLSNFLSFGQTPTTIYLNKRGKTLIVGKNGSGKSGILSALTFALFGKPFRKINIPQLVNSINSKNCITEVEFTKNKKSYRVVRGIKPNVFEIYIDGVMIDQDSRKKDYQKFLEKHILGFTYKSFIQVVILGSSTFVPFMRLTQHERRMIIEDILDIDIFSKMNMVLKQKIQDTKESIRNLQHKLDIQLEKISAQKKLLEQDKRYQNEQIQSKQDSIEKTRNSIENEQQTIEKKQNDIDRVLNEITDESSLTEYTRKIENNLNLMNQKITGIRKSIGFFSDNDICPTCKQNIEQEFKNKEIEQRQNLLENLQNAVIAAQSVIDKKQNELQKILLHKKEIESHRSDIRICQSHIESYKSFINRVQLEIQNLQKSSIDMDKNLSDMKALLNEMKKLQFQQKQLQANSNTESIALELLKDSGIKSVIIRQYIPIINKLINKHLMSMDFFVNFTLSETFEETIKSRFRDEFSYESFSEGEKQRIDLALLFTWREVARMKNSLNTNLLILDEVMDSSLDAGGMDTFLEIIKSLPKNTNIFVISHRGDTLVDKGFDSMLKFRKDKNFSVIDYTESS